MPVSHDHQHPPTTPDTSQATGQDVSPDTAPGDHLVLDIGGDVGALVIYATADHDGAEIEISPASALGARSHNVVRTRRTQSAGRPAAVFPALPAGDYIVWRDRVTAAGTITIRGGEVTEFHLG
jgi:hypothetical protein